VVDAFRKDWAARSDTTVDIITGLLTDCLSLQLSENIGAGLEAEECRQRLFHTYSETLVQKEKIAHQRIRSLFKHNIFSVCACRRIRSCTPDLFDERTWQLLGLTKKQVMIAGGLGGAGHRCRPGNGDAWPQAWVFHGGGNRRRGARRPLWRRNFLRQGRSPGHFLRR